MNQKPLGIKSYGSIPHLPGSRQGRGDIGLSESQAALLTTKTRDRHDIVIVTEKLDGSNVAVANVDGELVPLIRAGYRATDGRFEQHKLFDAWVRQNAHRFDFLKPGERLAGEWLAQVHGTRYKLPHQPFVPFDILRGTDRASYAEFTSRVAESGLVPAALLHEGGAIPVADALSRIRPEIHGSLDKPEGVVYRIEQRGAFDFIAKYVSPDKVDGLYLPEVEGSLSKVPLWNYSWEDLRAAAHPADAAPAPES